MGKLPKEIYVDESSDELRYFTNAKDCARTGETVSLAVYKRVGTVRVDIQIREEIVINKVAKAKKRKPDPADVIMTNNMAEMDGHHLPAPPSNETNL